MISMPGSSADLRYLRRRIEDVGLGVVKGGDGNDAIVVPKAVRDAQIEDFERSLDRMGAVGIHKRRYNFMP